MNTLDSILAKAKEAAANLPVPAAVGSTPAVYTGGGGISIDTVLDSSGVSVDSYLQVDAPGIKLSKDWQGFIDDFEAILDLTEVVPFRGARGSIGNQTTYLKTYDGVNEARLGIPFAQASANLRAQAGSNFTEYAGFELPFELVNDAEDPKKKGKTIEAGQRVGLTTSPTGSTPAQSFLRKLRSAGLMTSVIKVKVSHVLKQKAGVKDWGVCDLELLDIVVDNRPDYLKAA